MTTTTTTMMRPNHSDLTQNATKNLPQKLGIFQHFLNHTVLSSCRWKGVGNHLCGIDQRCGTEIWLGGWHERLRSSRLYAPSVHVRRSRIAEALVGSATLGIDQSGSQHFHCLYVKYKSFAPWQYFGTKMFVDDSSIYSDTFAQKAALYTI